MRQTPAALLLLAVAITTASCVGGASRDVPSDMLPNILVVLVDDMGYGDVGRYNPDSKIPTPHLDRMADEGMRFTDAHAPGSWCTPTRYGLLTGRYPHRVDVSEWNERALIEPEQPTLATLLRGQGYATYMVGKWHLGFDGGSDYDCSKPLRGGPVDHGFDRYFGIPASLDIPPYFYILGDRCVQPPSDRIDDNGSPGDIWTRIQGAFWRGGGIAPEFRHEEVLSRLGEEAVTFLTDHERANPDQPYFMYLALTAPHTPWLPEDAFRGASEAGLYGDFVAQVDAVVGGVLDAVADENTLVVFTSDNGPVWYDKDERRFDHRSAHIFRGMKGDAWEGGHRMPFIVRWPERVRAGSESGALLSFTDLYATFAALVGGNPPDSTDSVNQLPVLVGNDRPSAPRTRMAHYTNTYLAVREGAWKLIPGLGSGGFTQPRTREPEAGEPRGQLYNLQDDPSEQTNLYAARPEVVNRLQTILDGYRN